MLGILGGSGFYTTVKGEERHVETPYGWREVVVGKVGDTRAAFIARHGNKHSIPPHHINHLANIHALWKLGCRHILGINACGIISKFKPGEVMTLDDFIAFHLGPITFHQTFAYGAKHTDMSEPYSRKMNKMIAWAGGKVGVAVKQGGVVATCFGPRFETPAEIKAFGIMGANLVSMTAAYEPILARELGIPYTSIAIGTNYAAGISKNPLSHDEVVDMMEWSERKVMKIVKVFAGLVK